MISYLQVLLNTFSVGHNTILLYCANIKPEIVRTLMLIKQRVVILQNCFLSIDSFSVNFTLGKQAVGIYLGIYEDMHQSKGNMSTEVFDCVKIETDIMCNLQWSQNNGT
jgi:hypothetical protein